MTDTKRRYMVLWLSELQGVKFNYWFDLSSAKVEFDGLKTFESVVYAVLVDIQHPEKDVGWKPMIVTLARANLNWH